MRPTKMTVLKAVTAALCLALMVVATPQANARAGAAESGEPGWIVVDGDFVVRDDAIASDPEPRRGAMAAEVGGFVPFGERSWGDYVVRLMDTDEGEIEGYRSDIEIMAEKINDLNGTSILVDPAVLPAPGDPGNPEVFVGEIVVLISEDGPCTGEWIGCAGPAGLLVVDGEQRFAAGVVWLHPDLATLSEGHRLQTVLHEFGHAFGLDHQVPDFEGQQQVMFPSVSGAITDYRSGDRNGLRWLVQDPPANDSFEAASPIGPSDASSAASTWFATAQPDESAHAGEGPRRSVWYRITTAIDQDGGVATVSTDAAPADLPFDTVLAVYQGESLADLTLIASNDDVGAGSTDSEVSFPVDGGEEYYVALDGYGFAVDDFWFSRGNAEISFDLPARIVRFADVPEGHQFFDAIQWMFDSGTSTGSVNPDGGKPLYQPADVVRRQAMGAFLYRLAGSPAVSGTPHFADVPVGHQFFDAIQWMFEAGVSTGSVNPDGGKPLFKPGDVVRRQAMGAFLYRLEGSPDVSASPHFADVPASHQFFDALQWMFESGTSTGSVNPAGGDPLFKPSGDVLRQAMAAFLYRIHG